jgi:hypothetical protein
MTEDSPSWSDCYEWRGSLDGATAFYPDKEPCRPIDISRLFPCLGRRKEVITVIVDSRAAVQPGKGDRTTQVS